MTDETHSPKRITPARSGRRQPAVLAWLHLARIYAKVARCAAAQLRDYNLTPAQFHVLVRVGVTEGRSQQELADDLLVTKGNMCGVIDRLSVARLLERRPDPDDRRPNRLYLTEAGRAKFAQVVPAHETLIAALLSGVAAADQRTLLLLLRRLDRSLPDE